VTTAAGTQRLCLTLWTADPVLARAAAAAGVDRVGVDLERRGKAQRQRGMHSWISDHEESALLALTPLPGSAALFARCDPPHAGTCAQVQRLLAAGVRVLMLPMYRTAADVRAFVDAVAGRARTVLLLETREAVALTSIHGALDGVDEVHVGLNDLARELAAGSRFALLGDPLLDDIAASVHALGLPLGVGGVGRPDDRTLPIPPDLVYARLAALGASSTLLSRTFRRDAQRSEQHLAADVRAARARYEHWREASDTERAAAGRELASLSEP